MKIEKGDASYCLKFSFIGELHNAKDGSDSLANVLSVIHESFPGIPDNQLGVHLHYGGLSIMPLHVDGSINMGIKPKYTSNDLHSAVDEKQGHQFDAEFKPNWISSPGITILNVLESKGLSVSRAAELTSIDEGSFLRLISGRDRIDEVIAERLERLGGSQKFWLNREIQYQQDLARLTSNVCAREKIVANPVDRGNGLPAQTEMARVSLEIHQEASSLFAPLEPCSECKRPLPVPFENNYQHWDGCSIGESEKADRPK